MKTIVDRIGLPALLEQTAEECTELSEVLVDEIVRILTLLDANKACARLAHACLKEARRLRGENPTPCTAEECKNAIMEEMADVALCLDILDDSDYTLDPIIAKAKLDRWHKRLDEAGK